MIYFETDLRRWNVSKRDLGLVDERHRPRDRSLVALLIETFIASPRIMPSFNRIPFVK